MPRLPRFNLPDIPQHVVQRGNNRQAVFFDDSNYQAYLEWLGKGRRESMGSDSIDHGFF